jgi:NAD(P)H dehydrogenase (quinone)
VTATAASSEGAEVRLRHVAELNQEMLISLKQYWDRHRSEIEHLPDASLEHIEWADGITCGTPTRFGNVAAQLKLFLDLAGELWQSACAASPRRSCCSTCPVGACSGSTRIAINTTRKFLRDGKHRLGGSSTT